MEKRREEILKEVEKKGEVRVADLSQHYKCSEVTIRNDIKALHAKGLLKRVHGGAIKIEDVPYRKYTAESIYKNVEQKKAIAKCAYEYINSGDTIIIDDASSSFYLALHIKEHPEKTVAIVTNSLLVGNEVAGLSHVELYMVGGHVGGHLAATMGDDTIENFNGFKVDKAFMGVRGINFEVGLTSIATPQMQVKRAILRVAQRVFVLVDSSKFGGGYVSVICPIDQVYKIVTDNLISEENRRQAEELGIPMIVAE
ncbi:DeoR/GlpR family transcriptional regulator of sugar metabolism [Aequitasia blattaphilus]|uniref:DeoR/GlpR family DNA-binding transcription regulator n=1 Tax=Aequitasia blattaphilus TaxID=2949332 RepID=A0ABT1E8J7_9FIRM|nr:DeoR/GlpR family DNA-binding transcription regulator [Aequitasia blattaphilus]MCP1102147.1 DeoR/GlpR family DNA-binding transcription regulator [Aequitasia blattaphilus]MCR8614787.1 DeoR/GlpR family DNA-binding transcription regulator [Aequitasia blattaphilus]